MRQLPSGTVALLFTDIEGSTQLLQQLGERYALLLKAYRDLLRAVFLQWHGHEVDTQGDSFFVAFARATDAVEAAVAAQRTLAAHRWPEGVTLRVRMGLHTGEPSLSPEGYVGIDVHHAARIVSAAHGGQVLLSQATRALVEDHLPEGVIMRDKGAHRLKDLQRPEHLFQLIITGLPVDSRPLNTLSVCANNLPLAPNPLLGREREVASVGQLLRDGDVRLVSLTGPGGTGKTRLALQVAADACELFADGMYFVDLAPVSDPALVLASIAQALGLREEGGQPLLEHLKGELRQKQMLLLLDNFEQVISAAVYVAELLATCPRLKLLLTSRVVLRVRAEREFVVPPLPLPDPAHVQDLAALAGNAAVALFVQRARAVKVDFRLSATNAPAVAGIVARLDGLPLAIELAAARLKLLTPQTLLTRLDRSLQVLTDGARDLVERQQTLRNTIEWSYNLLDGGERRLFQRLCVFVGGCSLEAVEALYTALEGDKDSVLQGMVSLADKSLLQRREDESRFVVLETIREFGWEALSASGEMEAVRKAHAAYVLAFTQRAEVELWGPEQAAWLDLLEQEHDNVRVAMQWSLEPAPERAEIALRLGVALRPFWYTRGYLSEGLDFLERALAQQQGSPAPLLAQALYGTARLYEVRGDPDRAEALLGESLALLRGLGDAPSTAAALHLQADIAWGRGDLGMARSLAEEALALFRTLGDRGAVAGLLQHLGGLAADTAEYARGHALLEESLAIDRELEDRTAVAETAFNLARLCFLSGGDLARANALLEESFALFSALGDKESIAYCLYLAGLLALERGDAITARSQVERAVTLFGEMRQLHGLAVSTAALAKVSVAQGDKALARSLYEESVAVAQRAANKLSMAAGMEGLAGVAASEGEYARAAQLWGAAQVMREAIGAPLPEVEHPAYERAVAAVRARIGDAPFAAAWIAGRAHNLTAALLGRED